jgi:dTDP-4-dehydrorhamnose reductase
LTTILLTGRTGQVGHELATALAPLGNVVATGREQLDLLRPDSIVDCVRAVRPDIIINAAGYTAVDAAEAEPERAMRINADAPGILAEEAKRNGALLMHYSTDYVYDGSKGGLYTEDDAPNPLNAYGRSKLAGEQYIIASGCRHLIFRTSWLYADRGTNFLLTLLDLARKQPVLRVVDDQIGSPTWAADLAQATASSLRHPRLDDLTGVYHVSAQGFVSRFEFAEAILHLAAQHHSGPWARITPCSTPEFPRPAQRPLRVATSKQHFLEAFGLSLPDWRSQLEHCLQALLRHPTAGWA